MNKKQLRKELNRIQKVDQELNVRIANLDKVNSELVESNIGLKESNNQLKESNNQLKESNIGLKVRINEQQERITEQQERINEQQERITEQQERINEQEERINEQEERITEQQERITEQQERITEQLQETKEIRRVQEQQGIDIAALAKALNSLEDKKQFFEDEYAEWEDRFNKINMFIEQNPDFKGLGIINRGVLKQAMDNAIKSIETIDEKICKLHKFMKEIQKFDEFNYNDVLKEDEDNDKEA